MLGEDCSDFGRHVASAAVHGPDHRKQVALRHALEHVAGRARSQSPLNFTVGVGRRQHDDPRVWELAANRYQNIRPVGAG